MKPVLSRWIANVQGSLVRIMNPPFETPRGYKPRAFGEVRLETPTVSGVSLDDAMKTLKAAKRDYPEMFG